MTHLKNNGIALGVHILIIFGVSAFSNIKGNGIIGSLLLALSFFAYIACGFFLLKSVKKSFLSVLFVAVAITVTLFCVLTYFETWESDMGKWILFVNPTVLYSGLIASLSHAAAAPDLVGIIVMFSSPLFPSLLMYLGMVLRRLFNRRKDRKNKAKLSIGGGRGMTHLKNNGIALGVHALLVCLCFAVCQPTSDSVFISDTLKWCLIAVCLLTYIACGIFLLRPVKNKTFLSVLAVTILVIITYIWLSVHYSWQSGLGEMLFATNPGFYCTYIFTFLPDAVLQVLASILFFLSPAFPSLLMYLGMVLRRLFNRHKEKRMNRNI